MGNFISPETPGHLTSRWTDLKYHAKQYALWNSKKRFHVNPAGRRSGKTELAKRKVIKRAMIGTSFDDPRFFAGAPTREQAKRIYWDDLKRMTPKWAMAKPPNESELTIYLINGAIICVLGMDKPERIEGTPWDGGILDEFGNMKADAWGAHIRPALSDRNGWCDLIGVPEGRNHYYDVAKLAQAEMMDPEGEWAYYHWVSADILPANEITAAKKDLDELTYLQEYEASFVNFTGQTYYPYNDNINLARIAYNPNQPLIFCFDFNVEPGVAAVIQEKGVKDFTTGAVMLGESVTGIIGEVYIPRNSNTLLVCNKLVTDWGDHKGTIKIYGDATGGARGTAKIGGSDWDLIKKRLGAHFGDDRIEYNIPAGNPAERDRVNAVNSRLLTMDKKVRLMIDPIKAPNVVKDFEGVQCVKGGSGEIDKKISPKLTHMCFAAGTMIELDTGMCAIEKVPDKGMVRTWDGTFVEYINCGKTQKDADTVMSFINDGSVICNTPYHQWLTKRGWKCAKDLKGQELINWKSKLSVIPNRNLMGSYFINAKVDIIPDQNKEDCIGLFGNIILEKYKKGFVSTIKIVTNQIIKSKTLKCLPINSMLKSIIQKIQNCLMKEEREGWKAVENLQKNGIKVKMVDNGILNIIKKCLINYMKKSFCMFVNIVKKSFYLIKKMVCFVPKNVRQHFGIIQKLTMKLGFVNIVKKSLKQINIRQQDFVREFVPEPLIVLDVKPGKQQDVYCINVPSYGCFVLENGAIVSNSDAVGYYIHKEFPVRIIQGGMVSVRGT
jgi:hypothetical protein